MEVEAEPLEPVVFVEAGDSGWDLQARVSSDSVSKSHAALEVDNYFGFSPKTYSTARKTAPKRGV